MCAEQGRGVSEVLLHAVSPRVFALSGVMSSSAPPRPSAVCVCVSAETSHLIMNVLFYTYVCSANVCVSLV